MTFTEKDVKSVADLANLRLSPEEIHKLAQDLGSIVSYMEKLNELDTTHVEPMTQVLFDADETATLREDVVRPTIPNAAALANAPASGAGYFKVPRVIDR
ncbi:MAG TPA: Asp-tRNA(Asn)/Glu-tRNA(Gln) amidotransferase subunit GatC [Bryobacteraceae bacterium]